MWFGGPSVNTEEAGLMTCTASTPACSQSFLAAQFPSAPQARSGQACTHRLCTNLNNSRRDLLSQGVSSIHGCVWLRPNKSWHTSWKINVDVERDIVLPLAVCWRESGRAYCCVLIHLWNSWPVQDTTTTLPGKSFSWVLSIWKTFIMN